jgi:phytoene dehydrogenase-like protein
MTTGQSYKTHPAAGESFDVIVIGSGLGGLCVAALLSRVGKRVLVLERHYVAGGFTHTFKRKGYEWDVGVHYVGEVHRKSSTQRRIFDYITDGELEWARMPDIYDKMFFGDDLYEFATGAKRLKASLVSYFPREKQAIEQYFKLINEARNAARAYFTERALPPLIGRLAHRFMGAEFMKYARRTTREVISELTGDVRLLGVLTGQYGDYGLPPAQSSFAMHALLARHYMDGASYPVGGAGSIAQKIAPIIEKSGGRILVMAGVKEIITRGRKAIGVRLDNGDEISAKLVISNAGVLNTFRNLISPDVAAQVGLRAKLQQVKPSASHTCCYVGIKESAQQLQLDPANHWIYPDYDHDLNIEKYLADPSSALPVTYISFPSAKDPSWELRYPSRSTIEVLIFTPYDWFAGFETSKWKRRGQQYEEYKSMLSERALEQLYNYVPQVAGRIDHCETSTPLSTRHFSNYDGGAIYGIDHSPGRFSVRWLRPHTPIRNLYLTGQDIVTGGVAGALYSGVLTASVILKRDLMNDIIAATRPVRHRDSVPLALQDNAVKP